MVSTQRLHYFLLCPLFNAKRSILLNIINQIDSTTLNKKQPFVTPILLCGDESFIVEVNLLIFNATIYFVLSTNRFDEQLYLLWLHKSFSFYSWLYGYSITIFKISIFPFNNYYFFVPVTPIIVMVPCDCCFYVCCANAYFQRKRSIFYIDLFSKFDHGQSPYKSSIIVSS